MQSCRGIFNTAVSIGAIVVGGLTGAKIGQANIDALTTMGASQPVALMLGLVLGSGVAYSFSRGIVIVQQIMERSPEAVPLKNIKGRVEVERRALSRRWSALSKGEWIGLAGVAVGAAALLMPLFQSKEPVVPWQRETLINAMTQGDVKTVALFVKSGWKLGSDEFFHLLRQPQVQPSAMKPVVDGKAVTGFEFCKGYKELAQIVGLPAPMPMPDGSVRFKTLDDAYLQDVEELSRDRGRWGLFVSMCGASALRQHYDELIAGEQSKVNAAQAKEEQASSPAAIAACKDALRKKFPLLDLINNPRGPNPNSLTYSKEDEFLANFQTVVMFSSGKSTTVQAVYEEALNRTCRPAASRTPREAKSLRLQRLQVIRSTIP
jgi:hypothetical protein